jgi:hypothetical protein
MAGVQDIAYGFLGLEIFKGGESGPQHAVSKSW